MRSHATAMSPSRNGSCGGISPSRNARAASASPSPRRTRTLAVSSLTPSSEASAAASAAEQAESVQVPFDIAIQRYERRRTALASVLLGREVDEERQNDEQEQDEHAPDEDRDRVPRAAELGDRDARPQHDEEADRAGAGDEHGR